MIDYAFVEDPERKETTCRSILAAIPAWFGLPDSNEEYARGVRSLPFIEAKVRASGRGLLEVKNLDESRENEEYRRTRLFYRKAGFQALDVLPELWGPENPCLVMVKILSPSTSPL